MQDHGLNAEILLLRPMAHIFNLQHCHLPIPQLLLTCLQVTCGCWDGFEGLEAMINLTQLTIATGQYLPEVPQPLQQLTGLQRLALLETGEKQSIFDLKDDVGPSPH